MKLTFGYYLTSEKSGGGLTLKGPTEDEKAIESRLEEGCYYLLFDARSHRGANQRSANG